MQTTFILLLIFLLSPTAVFCENSHSDSPYLEFHWPRDWTIFGPFDSHHQIPHIKDFSNIPDEIIVSSQTFHPIPGKRTAGVIDLVPLLIDGSKEQPYGQHEGQSAYLFAKITTTEHGILLAGAGADWWMSCYIDGQCVLDTMEDGNGPDHYSFSNHPFRIHLKPGPHIIAIHLRSGRNGWKLFTDGGHPQAQAVLLNAEKHRDDLQRREKNVQEKLINDALINSKLKIAIYGSSVAKGTGAKHDFGWANRLGKLLKSKNWSFVNKSIGGDNTLKLLARMDRDLLAEKPDIVVIALSLANEGIMGGHHIQIYQQYRRNIRKIIQVLLANGITPVVANCYPNEHYTDLEYLYAQKFNEELSTWPIYSFDFMGAIDNGTGQWAANSAKDAGHPNDRGHEEMTHSIPPTCFDFLMGHDYSVIRPAQSFQTKAFMGKYICTTDRTLHSFTYGFEAKISSFPMQDTVLGGFGTWKIHISKNGNLICSSNTSTKDQLSIPLNSTSTAPFETAQIAISYSYAQKKMTLYLNGTCQTISEISLETTEFYLSGVEDNNSAVSQAVEFRNVMIYYSSLKPIVLDKIYRTGSIPFSSLALFAPLNDAHVAKGLSLINVAPTGIYFVAE